VRRREVAHAAPLRPLQWSRPQSQRPGLGLAIARGLAEAHAGDIAVQNELQSDRFAVRLPSP